MNLILRVFLIIGGFVLAVPAHATIYTGQVASDAFVTVGGYDLAWASPCSDGVLEYSCGAIDLTEQAGNGWNIMDSSLFNTLGISASTFIVNYSSANTENFNGIDYAKATGWFSNSYTHIDVFDGLAGYWAFADVAENNCCYETIVYRSNDNVAPVPEPQTYAMLLAGLGLIGFAARKRNNFSA